MFDSKIASTYPHDSRWDHATCRSNFCQTLKILSSPTHGLIGSYSFSHLLLSQTPNWSSEMPEEASPSWTSILTFRGRLSATKYLWVSSSYNAIMSKNVRDRLRGKMLPYHNPASWLPLMGGEVMQPCLYIWSECLKNIEKRRKGGEFAKNSLI